jgi:hypothetical protein
MKALYPMTLRTTLFAVAALLVLQGCPVANGQGAVPAVGPVGDNVQPPQPGIDDYRHLYHRCREQVIGVFHVFLDT